MMVSIYILTFMLRHRSRYVVQHLSCTHEVVQHSSRHTNVVFFGKNIPTSRIQNLLYVCTKPMGDGDVLQYDNVFVFFSYAVRFHFEFKPITSSNSWYAHRVWSLRWQMHSAESSPLSFQIFDQENLLAHHQRAVHQMYFEIHLLIVAATDKYEYEPKCGRVQFCGRFRSSNACFIKRIFRTN